MASPRKRKLAKLAAIKAAKAAATKVEAMKLQSKSSK